MKETVVNIGMPRTLTGVFTEPDAFDSNQVAVLILNSGIMHHIGACRMSVKLAWQLAEQGLASLRFDFSGIGDSGYRSGRTTLQSASIKEVQEVMDFLQRRRNIQRFLLFGLCSGAVIAFETAKTDSRVAGISQIDGYSHRNPHWYWHHIGNRALNAWKKGRLIPRLITKVSNKLSASDLELEAVERDYMVLPAEFPSFPSRQEVERDLEILVGKGVYMQTIFTSGARNTYNYPEQYRETYSRVEFGEQLEVKFYPAIRHIISEPDYQIKILGDVTDWCIAVNQKASDVKQQGR